MHCPNLLQAYLYPQLYVNLISSNGNPLCSLKMAQTQIFAQLDPEVYADLFITIYYNIYFNLYYNIDFIIIIFYSTS